MIDLLNNNQDHIPAIPESELSDEQVIDEIWKIKKELKDEVYVLGHHYQHDEIIQFADAKGDSLALAKMAADISHPNIIFCGVHFMAETADMLTKESQNVILPDLRAGCSMADMAVDDDIETAWEYFQESIGESEKIVPITYINCTASLKAFVGKHDGSICTSSNAEKIISWALNSGTKLLFFPDQHLGRNTCSKLGIGLDEMVTYNPNYQNGGLTPEQIKKAKVILWYGYCSVHQGFTKQQVDQLKKDKPETISLVHPECSYEVVQAADDNGSTAYIIDKVKAAPKGASFAIGTEINLVNRLASEFPEKEIFSLSPYQCLCTTMYRVRPRWLLASFRAIKNNAPINIIKVDPATTTLSIRALDRMLNI